MDESTSALDNEIEEEAIDDSFVAVMSDEQKKSISFGRKYNSICAFSGGALF